MKTDSRMLSIILAAALAAGCTMNVKVREWELPKTQSLGIDPAKKLPLTVAVVVPDPMGYTADYQAGNYRRDFTANYRKGGLPLERELSKLCSETFSQAFRQVVVVRELPQPGTYDAVVQVAIGRIGMTLRPPGTSMIIDVAADWSLTVLDKENREILSRRGITPPKTWQGSAAPWSIMDGFAHKIPVLVLESMGELAKEWGAMLHASEALAKRTSRP